MYNSSFNTIIRILGIHRLFLYILDCFIVNRTCFIKDNARPYSTVYSVYLINRLYVILILYYDQ